MQCGYDLGAHSATGTRTRVARVRAEYPNQLDYSGSVCSVPPTNINTKQSEWLRCGRASGQECAISLPGKGAQKTPERSQKHAGRFFRLSQCPLRALFGVSVGPFVWAPENRPGKTTPKPESVRDTQVRAHSQWAILKGRKGRPPSGLPQDCEGTH